MTFQNLGPNETIHRNGLVFVKLTQHKWAIVDGVDYDKIKMYRWGACRDGKVFYARAGIKNNDGGYTNKSMHRLLMNARGLQIDHRNGNGLDNRKCNIRKATDNQNKRNRTKQNNNTSGFKGVSFCKRRKKWVANIKVNNRNISLGRFITPEAAALAYKAATIKYHKDFARF